MKSKIVALSKNEDFKNLLKNKKISNKYFTLFFGPIDNPITKINVPNHLPKMKPANSATGTPKPPIITQMIVKIKNNKDNKKKLPCFNSKK